jgi:hypothetical protein
MGKKGKVARRAGISNKPSRCAGQSPAGVYGRGLPAPRKRDFAWAVGARSPRLSARSFGDSLCVLVMNAHAPGGAFGLISAYLDQNHEQDWDEEGLDKNESQENLGLGPAQFLQAMIV